MKISPMQFHGPGWTLDTDTDGFMLWAPQDGSVPDPHAAGWSSSNPPRDHWAASWHVRPPEDADEDWLPSPFRPGGFWRGATAADVLAHFPDDVRQRFLKEMTA
jgi:hypothetical protein